MVEAAAPRMPHKGEVKRRGEPPIGGGIKAARSTRLGRSTGSGTDAAGTTTLQPQRGGPGRGALRLAGRESRGGDIEIGRQSDLDERLPCVALGSAEVQPELDVLARRQVGDEAGFLRHERDVAAS